MNPALLIGLALIGFFLLGVLVGSGMVTRAQDARSRRQAALQHQLNEEWQALWELQEEASSRDGS